MATPLDKFNSYIRAGTESTGPASPLWSTFATDIMEAAITDSIVTKFLTLDLDPPTNDRGFKFEATVYKQNVLPNLINKVILALGDTSLKNDEIEKIKLYLSNDGKNPKYEEAYAFVKNAETTLRDRIALGRNLLQNTIPRAISFTIASISKNMDTQYGPELEESGVTVPYKVKQVSKTPKGTSFADPYEAMLLNMIDSMRSQEMYKRINEKRKSEQS